MTKYIYVVHSDIDENNLYAEFETEAEAIEYATNHVEDLTYVDKVEVALDEEGEISEYLEAETIWVADYDNMIEDDSDDFFAFKDEEVECQNCGNLVNAESCRKTDGGHYVCNHCVNEDVDALVETLEENEDIVECKECFELFPKADCTKIEVGYVCPHCHCGEKDPVDILVIPDEELFKLDFPEYEKFKDENDMIPVEAEEVEVPAESSEPEVEPKEEDKTEEPESKLEEHVNEEHPAIESDQELEGTDNAVVDCEVADVVTHSEDEKPLDCEMEKAPLEKPLTEEVVEEEAHAQFAKPEGNRIQSYNNALKYAKQHNADFIYGYTNHTGKFFALEQPIKMSDIPGKTEKEFRNKYKNCSTVYVAYPDKDFIKESLEHEELTSEQLADIENYLKTVGDLYLEDYEQEYDFAIDIVGGNLTYNEETNTFDFYLSIYHASEDNNAENVEYHTDEEDYSFDTIEEVYDEFPGYLEDIYKWNAYKISKVEEAIQMTRDELMDKEGTDDVELINAGRPEEERVELVEDSEEVDSTFGMDFDEACKKFGVEIED